MLRAEAAAPLDLTEGDRLAPTPRQMSPSYAALDLGTNNCRLLIARRAGGGFRVIDAFSRIVRLGEGLAATGALSAAAMARTVEALRICAGKIDQRRVAGAAMSPPKPVGARRIARDFLARVRDEIGIEIEIISTAEEARLVVSGCAPLLHPRIPYAIVFDIGGGSTEIVWVRLRARGARPAPAPARSSARCRCRSGSSP